MRRCRGRQAVARLPRNRCDPQFEKRRGVRCEQGSRCEEGSGFSFSEGAVATKGTATVQKTGVHMENPFGFMDTNAVPCASFSSGEAHMTEGPGMSCSREADSLENTKLTGDLSGASAEIKPKSIRRAKTWSGEVENLYRFQQAGYRDETEYKQVKHVSVVERWPETGFVKKLQRRDNTFYYYDKERECEDKEVHKVKVYAY